MTGAKRVQRVRQAALAIGVAVAIIALVRVMVELRPAGAFESRAALEREIAPLTRERDSLRAILGDQVERSPLFDRRPEGDVLIGLPTPFVKSLIQDIVTGWFHDVEVRLHDLPFHKAGDVRARLGMLGRQRVGSYDMDITFDEVRARITATAPALEFGGDLIKVALPLRVTGGTVAASIAIEWESRGLADAICGDLAARQSVSATIRERDHIAIGRLVLGAHDGMVVVDPEFPDLAIRLFVDPTPASVAALDSLLASKRGLCGFALDKAHTGDLIQRRVARGFLVRIPQKFFRPVRLPIAVEREVPMAGGGLTLVVAPRALVVTPAAAWLAADVRIAPRP